MDQTMPVIIQDKNGKTTTVHRSTAPKASPAASLLPVPPVPAVTPTEITSEYVISLLEDFPEGKVGEKESIYTDVSKEHVDDALEYIHYVDEGVLPYAVELMTSGTVTGQIMAKRKFANTVNNFAVSVSEMNSDPEWDINLPDGEDIKAVLQQVWNIGNVIDECGMPNTKRDQGQVEVLSGFIHAVCRSMVWSAEEVRPKEDAYCRGLAALVLTDTVDAFPSKLPEHSREFISWAGRHENLAPVIRVARERQVLHPETIEGILNQSGVEEVLRDGLL